jgi:hypothetical protein
MGRASLQSGARAICFRTIRQRGMTSDRARHTVWIFCAKTILQDPFGQATIAAISGSVPTMFITRVRLQVGTRFCIIRRIAQLVKSSIGKPLTCHVGSNSLLKKLDTLPVGVSIHVRAIIKERSGFWFIERSSGFSLQTWLDADLNEDTRCDRPFRVYRDCKQARPTSRAARFRFTVSQNNAGWHFGLLDFGYHFALLIQHFCCTRSSKVQRCNGRTPSPLDER